MPTTIEEISNAGLRDEADAVVNNMEDAESSKTDDEALANLRCAMDAAQRFVAGASKILMDHKA